MNNELIEKIKNEKEKCANLLNMSEEELETKWLEIAEKNNLNLEVELDNKICLGLLRSWFGGMLAVKKQDTKETTSNSLVKRGFGLIVAVEDVRDWEENKRDTLQGEYMRNRDEAFNAGKFATIETLDDGSFKIIQIKDNEVTERIKDSSFTVPSSVMEIDGNTIIPLDTNKTNAWDGSVNKRYGLPRPENDYQRNIYFIGEVGDSGIRKWTIKAKNEIAKDWNVEPFRFVNLTGIWNADNDRMYPISNSDGTTLTMTIYNDEMENPQDVAGIEIQDLLIEHIGVVPLHALEHTHNQKKNEPFDEKLIVTDGNVMNIILKPNVTGNRVLFIADLDADYSYEDGNFVSTPCWLPPHLNIDFGLGSHVVILGRTSQSTNKDTGELRQVSINTLGILVLDKRGNAVEYVDSGEDDSDWWD